MKRALLFAALLLTAAAAQARASTRAEPQSFRREVLPRCPGGTLTNPTRGRRPANFNAYAVTLRNWMSTAARRNTCCTRPGRSRSDRHGDPAAERRRASRRPHR
jgi:hypothetical protein